MDLTSLAQAYPNFELLTSIAAWVLPPRYERFHLKWHFLPLPSPPLWWGISTSITRWRTRPGTTAPRRCRLPFLIFRERPTWDSHCLIPPASTQGFPLAVRPGLRLLILHLLPLPLRLFLFHGTPNCLPQARIIFLFP